MTVSPIELNDVAGGTGGFVIYGSDIDLQSGYSVASAGDINGDGFDDLIIGTNYAGAFDSGGNSYVVFGMAGGFALPVFLSHIGAGTGGFRISGGAPYDRAGTSVASAGDINGDGLDDLIIGARGATAPGYGTSLVGKSYVIFGKTGGFAAHIDLVSVAAGSGGFVIYGQDGGEQSGTSVASAGDINGDGFDDLIIGAPFSLGAENSMPNAGDSYVVFGKADGFAATVDLGSVAAGIGGFVIYGQDFFDQSGTSVASAGDINGDGFDDLIIGAPFSSGAGNSIALAGDSYVVFGKAGGFAAAINLASVAAGTGGFVINGHGLFDQSGTSVASAGDINGDGFDDLIIGVRNGDALGNAKDIAGESYVVFGKAGGFAAAINLAGIAAGTGGFVIYGRDAGDRSGSSVASAGDINGDGFDDLIIGAPSAYSTTGGAYVLFGHAGGFPAAIDLASIAAGTGGFVIRGQDAADRSGFSVASAGDVDGDGFDDLIIGAPYTDSAGNAVFSAGNSYVIFGRDFTATVTHPGTASAETLTGSTAANNMVAGQGNDTLIGAGGADVLLGGAGNDTLSVADLTFARLDGGSGIDRLVLSGAGMALDLASIANTRLQNMEVIDLTGTGNNSLVVSALEVLNLSSTSNALKVDGNAGDSISLAGQGWFFADTSGGYRTYTNGQASVQVASPVNVAVVLPFSIDLADIAAGTGGFAILGQEAGDRSGISVASAGDINRDGFDDLLIGASGADASGNAKDASGESYVVFGKAGGFAATIGLAGVAAGTGGFVIYGQDAGDQSGTSVASAGDINGDGFDDLLIGAFLGDAAGNATSGAGDSYVVFGKAGGFAATIDLAAVAAGTGGFVIYGETANDRSGRSVATAGDINGDGFDDLIIGASLADAAGDANSAAGDSYVLFGRASGFGVAVNLASVAAGTGGFVIHGPDAGDQSGDSVASAGDLNGDGFDDLVIGARLGDAAGNAKADAGDTYVVFGRASGFAAATDLAVIAAGTGGFVLRGEDAGDNAGVSVASVGDLNGDGFDDLVIGAQLGDAAGNAESAAGDSYVVFGKASGFAAGIDLATIALGSGGFVIRGLDAGDNAGFSVASAGDLNGDGFDDLVIGARFGDAAGNAKTDAGDSFVVFGRASGFAASIGLADIARGTGGFAIHGRNGNDQSGTSVASAGDIDGDGFDDLVIGASNAASSAGTSYVIFGRDFNATVTHLGTAAAETLTGSAAANTMVAGQGDDTLVGAGGADVLLGGAGNDTLRIADLAFARIDGGSGIDTLAIAGAGIALNLAAIANTRLQNIEAIDLTGTGNNSLVLSALEVLNLSSTSNALKIDGNAGDSVAFGDSGWVQGANAAGYTPWSNGQASVQIKDGVIPCFAPGTRIATPFGWRAIETLGKGDAVLTAGGQAQRLSWAGGWDTDPTDAAHRAVCIRAHAFEPGRPAQDLVVSPSHALWLGGVLVPAVALLDGLRVVRVAAPARYHHIALPQHGVILAEDQPVETFCPHGEHRYPGAPIVSAPMPRLEDGPGLEALRARLGLGPRPGGGTTGGFLERILPIAGGIVVEGWASGPGGAERVRIDVAGQSVSTTANRWRIDLDRAGLPAAGFRCFVPLAKNGVVQVRCLSNGQALPPLAR